VGSIKIKLRIVLILEPQTLRSSPFEVRLRARRNSACAATVGTQQ
jgi:hypothetical protein